MDRHALVSGALLFRSSILKAIGVPHAFTTRIGRDGKAFDAGPVGSAPEEELFDLLGLTPERPRPRLAEVRQVHGAAALEARASSPPVLGEADALFTEEPSRALFIRTADCVPILVASSDGRRVAAIHAGWRGIVAGVIRRTLEALGPGEYLAAIGPCLSPDHFEVGAEVEAAFEKAGLGEAICPREGARSHIDLRLAVTQELARAGLAHIDPAPACTYAERATLYSYRRDVTHAGAPSTGRLGALILPRAN